MPPVIDWKHLAQVAARHLKEAHLIEMTPGEIDAARRSGYQKIRELLLAKGYILPPSDEELFLLLGRIFK